MIILLSNALKLHPAGILIAALVGAGFLGLIGVVLAAPVLATLRLVGSYLFSKMFDLDPWENFEVERVQVPETPEIIIRIKDEFIRRIQKLKLRFFIKIKEEKEENEKHE
ncbi:MAG: hypothetical protein JEZ06_23885 [Anaerolineaceae bacterium]|nr:hypothetical protein [Anaerolineaceae bacterium]